MSRYFLAKTEPSTYSIYDLASEGQTPWDGVHNHQAIKVIKSWQPGDYVFIYHSMGQARIVGLARVISEPRKDLEDPRDISWLADLEFVREYPEEQKVTLKEVKATGRFTDFALVRQSRLSVMKCTTDFVNWLQEEKGLTITDS